MVTIDGADKNVNGGNATYVKNKDGSVTWTNATEDTKRVGDAMLKTDIGQKKLDDMISSDVKIKIDDNKTDEKTFPGQNPNAITQGWTETTGTTTNADGSVKVTSETVHVYEKGIDEAMQAGEGTVHGQTIDESKYTKVENVGAIGTHEATHATEPASNGTESPRSTTRENTPYKNQFDFYKQLQKQTKVN